MERTKFPVAETGLSLPPDVMEEILLRVPAKQLRRFRAVCRSWRSLLSDPSFVNVHAALRPALILALSADDDHIGVLDFSGQIVKQIRIPAAEEDVMPPPHPGPSFLFRANSGRVRMVVPDTGAVFTLPFDDFDKPTLWHSTRFQYMTRTDYVLGRVTSTGNHKVLRIFTGIAKHANSPSSPFKQLCHVLTLGGNDEQRWRQRPGPPMFVKSNVGFHGVSIRGLIYFLSDVVFKTHDRNFPCNHRMYNVRAERIASFDLEKEQWRPTTLGGPLEIGVCRRILTEVRNTLVMMAHYDDEQADMKFWFAEDLEKGLWVKKLAVRQGLLEPYRYMSLDRDIRQVVELEDGRIVISYFVSWVVKKPHWWIRVYDPRTKAYTDSPQLGDRSTVGVYVGRKPSILDE